jgi:hypothetical protein
MTPRSGYVQLATNLPCLATAQTRIDVIRSEGQVSFK